MKHWIGVDFDGTLAHYDGWIDGSCGEPIVPMVDRVKEWLADGKVVKIFTARVGNRGPVITDNGIIEPEDFANAQRKLIQEWCLKHIGQVLEVTCSKDFGMYALYDDRCIRVEENTGRLMRE